MPAYDATFNPPAPVADVIVSHPVTGAKSNALRGKFDTGADVIVIPEQLVRASWAQRAQSLLHYA